MMIFISDREVISLFIHLTAMKWISERSGIVMIDISDLLNMASSVCFFSDYQFSRPRGSDKSWNSDVIIID